MVCNLLFGEAVERSGKQINSSNKTLGEQVNSQLPKWLTLSGSLRERTEATLGTDFGAAPDDLYNLHRIRFGVLIKPTSWFRIFGQTQDVRSFGSNTQPGSAQNIFDIQQAYVELGKPDSKGLSLRAGRQEMELGKGWLVGPAMWRNSPRKFDAVRATLQSRRVKIDAFAGAQVVEQGEIIDHHRQGDNLHGIYGTLTDIIPKATLEPFSLWRVRSGSIDGVGIFRKLNFVTTGFRLDGELPHHLDYEAEMALQTGSRGTESIRAWAGRWSAGYTIEGRPKLRPFAEYIFASGDANAGDQRYGTFDPLYPNAHDKLGFADQFGWRNIKDFRVGSDIKPTKQWSITASYHNFWLANAQDGLYDTAKNLIFISDNGEAGSYIGSELDLIATYKPRKSVKVDFGYAHIFTGEFLNATSNGKDFNYPYASVEYSF